MAIYRGPGGAGDATNDASSQAVLATEAATQAAASAAAAASSASSASTSATNSANSATASANSATLSANSATASASSATASANSATEAANSAASIVGDVAAAEAAQAAASASASAAATSATNAAASATSAASSATTATTQATNAASSASSAATSASSASSSATSASTSAVSAASSATQAATSAASASAIVLGTASNRASIRPTLLLDFDKTKILDPRLSFSRASSAKYTDVFGTIKTASNNEGRFTHDPITSECLGLLVEPQRTNLVLASQAFDQQNLFTYSGTFSDAAWTKTRSSVTSGQSDPFSGTGAFKLAEDTSNNTHVVSQLPTTAASTPYVFSVYLKAAERGWATLTWGSTNSQRASFNLSAGTAGTVVGAATNATIISVGSGWYRCSVVFTPTSANAAFNILLATADDTYSYTGTTGSGIYIYGAQVERSYSTTPSAYYATTSAAWQPWTATQTTLTPSAGTAPDGTNSAYKVVPVSGQSVVETLAPTNYIRSSAITVSNTTNYTVSVYAKASGYNSLSLRFSTNSALSAGNASRVVFNLSLGTVSSVLNGFNAAIQSVGNGWYRCSVSGLSAATTYYTGLSVNDSSATTADGTSGILLWGFQVEQAEDSSSYITTTTSQVTRAADVISASDTGWLNQTEGTFYVDRKLRALNDNQTLFSLDNGTSDIEVRSVKGTNTTNILTFTEQFDAAIWTKSNCVVVPNAATAPDGTSDADSLLTDTTTGSSKSVRSSGGSAYAYINQNTNVTCSVYVKKNGLSSGFIALSQGTAMTMYATARFDLDTLTTNVASASWTTAGGTDGSVTITAVGNGWYRVSYSCTTATSATGFVMRVGLLESVTSGVNATWTVAPSGTTGLYIWGAQLETSSSASTYEPNPKFLTSYEIGSTGLIQTGNYASVDIPNLYQKSTFGYKTNDTTYYRGGSPVGTDTTVTLPTGMNRLVIGGSAINSGREINGTIKRVTYFPRLLSNIEQIGETS